MYFSRRVHLWYIITGVLFITSAGINLRVLCTRFWVRQQKYTQSYLLQFCDHLRTNWYKYLPSLSESIIEVAVQISRNLKSLLDFSYKYFQLSSRLLNHYSVKAAILAVAPLFPLWLPIKFVHVQQIPLTLSSNLISAIISQEHFCSVYINKPL